MSGNSDTTDAPDPVSAAAEQPLAPPEQNPNPYEPQLPAAHRIRSQIRRLGPPSAYSQPVEQFGEIGGDEGELEEHEQAPDMALAGVEVRGIHTRRPVVRKVVKGADSTSSDPGAASVGEQQAQGGGAAPSAAEQAIHSQFDGLTLQVDQVPSEDRGAQAGESPNTQREKVDKAIEEGKSADQIALEM